MEPPPFDVSLVYLCSVCIIIIIIIITIVVMCGIHVLISAAPVPQSTQDSIPGCSEATVRRLRARGPDHWGQVRIAVPGGGNHGGIGRTSPLRIYARDDSRGHEAEERYVHVCFTSTVLALRGNDGEVTAQPFVSLQEGPVEDTESRNPQYVFCWNGEAWGLDVPCGHGGTHNKDTGLSERENDGAIVFRLLCEASAGASKIDDERVIEVLRRIRGPFAFVFLDVVGRRLYYGRDRLGRRSLVTHIQQTEGGTGPVIRLSSVVEDRIEGWKEVPARGIHVLRLDRLVVDLESAMMRVPWLETAETDDGDMVGDHSWNMRSSPADLSHAAI